MKKDFIADQTITIKIPADPTHPAEVAFTPGPCCEEAARLSETPGSGWKRPPTKKVDWFLVVSGHAPLKLNDSPLPLSLPKDGADETCVRFLVDRRVLTSKPLRKPRPDASKRMSAYNRARAKRNPAPKE